MELEKISQVARAAALEAGAIARDRFMNPGPINGKGFRDVITEVDLAAQEQITSKILQAFPDHGFLTEEEDGSLPSEGPVIWIIDPIDGTINYSRQIPIYAISIAVARHNSPLTPADLIAGVVYDPMREELFATTNESVPTLNGREVHASQVDSLSQADFSMDWHRYPEARQATFNSVSRLIHEFKSMRALNSAALAMAWVAAGRLDAYFNFALSAWDMAAGSLLVQQAGGRVTDVKGQSLNFMDEMIPCLASNGCLHDELLSFL